ncbi:hypothetical protein [Micromonospora sagamiensis]|nr:hypothetical protein [Micromonospora sagamiensis]
MTATVDEPVRPARPTTVTVAFWLQLAAVGVLLVMVGLTVAAAVQFDGRIDRAAQLVPDADPDEVSGERFGNWMTMVAVVVPALFLAVWFAATARPVRRGGNTARILVFVGGGLQLLLGVGQCCLGALFIPLALGAPDEGWTETADGEPVWEESEFVETLYDSNLSEDLLGMGAAGGGLVVFLLSVAVVLLLALPPANRYFVPRDETPPGAMPAPWAAHPVLPAVLPTHAPPPGYPAAPVYVVPPGYMICPDPSRHLPPPAEPEGPSGTAPATPGS